jgi:hypothetical protein
MTRKPCYRAFSAHTITLEAITELYWEAFENVCEGQEHDGCARILGRA